MGVKERLIGIIENDLAISIGKFEELCGLGNNNIKKSKGINSATLEKIADKCPDIDLNYLIRGKEYQSEADRIIAEQKKEIERLQEELKMKDRIIKKIMS